MPWSNTLISEHGIKVISCWGFLDMDQKIVDTLFASAINGADSITTDSKLLDDIKYGTSTKPAVHKGIASKNNQQPTEIPCTKADTRTSTPNKTSPRQTDDPKVLDSTRRGPPCKANKPILTNTSILLKQKIDAKPVKSNSTINLRTTVQVSSAVFEQFEMPKSSTFISKSKLAFLPVQQVTGTPRQMENKTFRKTVTEKNGLYQPAFVALQRSHLRRQNTLSLPSLSQAASRSLSMEEPRDLLKTFSDPGERQVTWYQPKRQVSILPKSMQRLQNSAFNGVTWKPTPAVLNPSTGSVKSRRSRVESITRKHIRKPGNGTQQSQVIDAITAANSEAKSASLQPERRPKSSGSHEFASVRNTPETHSLFQEPDPQAPPKYRSPENEELSKSVRESPDMTGVSNTSTPLQNGPPIKPIEKASDAINDK